MGTSFSESESFVGKIAYLDIWNRFLSSSEVLEYYSSCEPYHGNLYAWSDFKNHIKGNIKVRHARSLTRSTFLYFFFWFLNLL